MIGGAADFKPTGITPNRYTEEPTKVSEVGDIILCIRATIGRANIGVERYCLGRGVAGLRAEAIDPILLVYLLRRDAVELDAAGTGTTFRQIDKSTLSDWPVSLPPLAEQRRIVAKLDALTARTARARADLDRIPALAARYKQAVLAHSFNTMNSETPDALIGDVSTQIFDGPFGSNLKTDDYVDAGARVVRLENIGHLSFAEDKRTFISTEKYQQLVRHTLQKDDLLFSSFVDEQIRVCLLPRLEQPTINKADCFCIRLDRDRVNPKFMAYRLACTSTFEQFKAMVHGATRPRINLTQLRSFRFRLPDLIAQAALVRRIETAFAEIDRLATEAAAARRLLDRLDQAILAKAFRGELLPQDPADEPASVLLARIKAARAGEPRRARRGRTLKVA